MKPLFAILFLASSLIACAAVPADILNDLASPDLAKRFSAEMSLRDIVFEAGKPGASAEDAAALEKQLLDLAADTSTALASRLWILEQLPYFATAKSVPGLKALLVDPDAQIREGARRALQNNRDPSASRPIIEALKVANDAPWVIGLMDSLAARQEMAAVDLIAARLTSENDAIAATAAQSLGSIGGKASFNHLSNFLPNCPATILPTAQSALIRCAIALAKIPPGILDKIMALLSLGQTTPKAEDALMTLWPQAANASIRFEIFSALANDGDGSKAAPLITELLAKQDTPGAREIFHFAMLSGKPSLTAPILAALPGLGEDARLAVHTALAAKSDTSQEADLLALAATLEGNKKAAAIELLGRSGTEKSLEFLTAEAVKNSARTFPAVVVAVNRLQVPALDERLMNEAQGPPGTQTNQAIRLLSFRNPTGTEALLLKLAAPDAPAGSRVASLSGLEVVGGYDTSIQLIKWIAETPKDADPKPLIGAFRRIAPRVEAASILWNETFLPAFQSASPENRSALLLTIPALRCEESGAFLVEGIRTDPSSRSAYLDQLTSWSNFSAGKPLLAAAALPDLDAASRDKIFQAATRLLFSTVKAPLNKKQQFAQELLAAAPEGAIRDSIEKAIENAKLELLTPADNQ
jgi:hypothetical protein